VIVIGLRPPVDPDREFNAVSADCDDALAGGSAVASLSAIMTATDHTEESLDASDWPPERRRLVRSLTVATVNLAAAFAYSEAARWLMPHLSYAWHGVPYAAATGIPIAHVFLLSLWLALGCGRWQLRYAAGLAAFLAGTLAALMGLWGGGFSAQTVRTVLMPLGGAVLALAVQLVAGLHLVLFPVRVVTGWRLDFGDLALPRPRRVVSRQRRTIELAIVVTLSLAAIWFTGELLRPMASSELLFHPRLLLTTLFAPVLVPLATCAWLVFASHWRWLAAGAACLALATPALLIGTSINEALQLETPQLWVVHWVLLPATAWTAVNLLVLRSLGLRLVASSQ